MGAEAELAASQALFAARTLEDALHHPGPWTMEWAGVEVPAVRRITDSGASFEATFPPLCYLTDPGGVVLKCDGRVAGMRRMDHPGDVEFVVTWDLIASSMERAVQ